MKYVYHFDDAPDELFDLSEDPLEEHNLAAAHPEEVEARRAELLEWRAKVNAMYGSR
jgi:arylsulfatase A-like enzyme